jgi:hypothetical protein
MIPRMNNFLGGWQTGAQASQIGIQHPYRPFGVSLIASVIGFIGGLYFFLMILLLLLLNLLSGFVPPPGTSSFLSFLVPDTASSMLTIFYLTALAFAHLAVARGLWLLKQWAYWTTIIVEGASILISLMYLAVSHNGLQFFTDSYLSALIIGYLLAVPSVRKTFRVPF